MRLPYNRAGCVAYPVNDLSPPAIACHHKFMAHPPRIPVWLPDEQSVIYFVTICVGDRKPVLANHHAFDAFKIAASKLKHWKVLAAVLMPDHRDLRADRRSRCANRRLLRSSKALDARRARERRQAARLPYNRRVAMAIGLF